MSIQLLYADIKRQMINRRADVQPDGVYLQGGAKAQFGGVFHTDVMRHRLVQRAIEEGDPEKAIWLRKWVMANGHHRTLSGYERMMEESGHNLVTTEGMKHILNVILGSASKISTWYVGSFTSDSTPTEAWTGGWAYSGSALATELANSEITGSARPSIAFAAATGTTTVSVATSTAASVTMEAGVTDLDIFGTTLNEASTIAGQNSGKICLSAYRYTTAKQGLGAGDVLNTAYTFSATNAA